ncbi:hypothetical protein FRC06_009898, partial [Ceratobasidium sp. 370]
ELPTHLRRPIPVNPTEARRAFCKSLLRKWLRYFAENPRRERMENLSPTIPSLTFELAAGLPRRDFAGTKSGTRNWALGAVSRPYRALLPGPPQRSSSLWDS